MGLGDNIGKSLHKLFAVLLIFFIITCAFALTVDENSSFVAIGIVTVMSAILFLGSIALLSPFPPVLDQFRDKIVQIEKSTCIMLAAAGLLSTISLSAVWHNSNNAKAIWVYVMNGLGTAFYSASVYALVMPFF